MTVHITPNEESLSKEELLALYRASKVENARLKAENVALRDKVKSLTRALSLAVTTFRETMSRSFRAAHVHMTNVVGQRDEATEAAATDGLTGAWSKRGGNIEVCKLWNRLRHANMEALVKNPKSTERKYIGIIQLDLDHFKKVNDTYGHGKGDEVLQTFTNAMMSNCRGGEIFLRDGGEEFLIVSEVSATSAQEAALKAAKHAERLREIVEKIEYTNTVDDVVTKFKVTMSAGIDVILPDGRTVKVPKLGGIKVKPSKKTTKKIKRTSIRPFVARRTSWPIGPNITGVMPLSLILRSRKRPLKGSRSLVNPPACLRFPP